MFVIMTKPIFILFYCLCSLQLVAQDLLVEAQQAYDQSKYKTAELLLHKGLEQDQSNLAYKDLLGQTYAKLEQWEQSAKYNKDLVNAYPKNAEYHFRYGGALGLYAKSVNRFKALTLLDDVKFHLKKAAQLDASHIEARWALIQLYMELPGIIGGSKSTAYTYANQLDAISPIDAALAKGFIEMYDDNFNRAEQFYKKAVKIGQSKTAYQKLIKLYQDYDKLRQVINYSVEAYQMTNEVSFLLQLNQLDTLNLYATSKLIALVESLKLGGLNSIETKKLKALKVKLGV